MRVGVGIGSVKERIETLEVEGMAEEGINGYGCPRFEGSMTKLF